MIEFFRPKKGSLTEYRGMKANIQVYQEMIDLCQVIHDYGSVVHGEPDLREITFGDLFQVRFQRNFQFPHHFNAIFFILALHKN